MKKIKKSPSTFEFYLVIIYSIIIFLYLNKNNKLKQKETNKKSINEWDKLVSFLIMSDPDINFSDYLFKILMIGDAAVGKSSVLLKYIVH